MPLPQPAPRRVHPARPVDVGVLGQRRRGTGVAAVFAVTAALVASLPSTPAAAAAGRAAGPLAQVVVTAVEAGAGGVSAAARAVQAAGGRVLDALPLAFGVSAELPADAVLPAGVVVSPNRPVRVSGGSAPPAGAPASSVRQTLGLGAPNGEGRGVTVAVVDTGVEPLPDLAGRLTQVDVSGKGKGSGDGYGHGTFVAGLIAGSGAASGGAYAGVAPGADVLSVRVADDQGGTDLVTVLRGLQVAAARGADVVNLSLSSYSPLPWQLDPLTLALTSLWERGTVVVVPAGNDGPGAGTITSPGVAPAVLTVGALDEHGTGSRANDTVSTFSARGPAPQNVAKPELVAPGQSVISLRDPGSVIDRTYGATAAVGSSYFKGSGTSFSTAVASGSAAALLAKRHLSPDQVKALLVRTAYQAPGLQDATAAGAGGLDLAAAMRSAVAGGSPDGQSGGDDGSRGSSGSARDGAGVLPGDASDWQPLLSALVRGDARAAASSWSELPGELRAWVASSWSALPAQMRAALTEPWAGRNWAGLTAEQWAAADWAARTWAGRNWAGRNWAGRNWAGRNWAGEDWSASSWSGRNWGASSWSGDWLAGWAGRNWAGRNWAGRNWAGRNWGASSWSGQAWAGRNWAGRTWAARTWAARSWAASSWS